jgi:hypothetical protein
VQSLLLPPGSTAPVSPPRTHIGVQLLAHTPAQNWRASNTPHSTQSEAHQLSLCSSFNSNDQEGEAMLKFS